MPAFKSREEAAAAYALELMLLGYHEQGKPWRVLLGRPRTDKRVVAFQRWIDHAVDYYAKTGRLLLLKLGFSPRGLYCYLLCGGARLPDSAFARYVEWLDTCESRK